jgi:hypothetical protein
MKTIEINLYQFSELSDEAKRNAIENLSDINIDSEWWDGVYDDAENVGLKITGFDIDRGSYVKAYFIESAESCAEKILSEHGEMCETFKTAKVFLDDRTTLVAKYSDGTNLNEVAEDNEYDFYSECDDLEKDFLKSICEDYRIMLSKNYDYLTSKAAIIETIEANEYDFTENGKLS